VIIVEAGVLLGNCLYSQREIAILEEMASVYIFGIFQKKIFLAYFSVLDKLFKLFFHGLVIIRLQAIKR